MLCWINKFRDSWRNTIAASLTSRSGQVAVILIVVIAIGLMFFAASINLTLVSQSKTITMKAASVSASSTASFLASYGQKEYVETMGRRIRYCKSFGGGLMGILTLIVLIVIAVVFSQYEILGTVGGVAGAASLDTMVAAGAAVGAVMEAASMIVAASIDPGISKAWNKMQNANLSITGQVMERGVQAALQAAVTDQEKIPDVYDLDGDGRFGYEDAAEQIPKDTIGRFSYINTKRYLGFPDLDTAAIADFIGAMHELVINPGDDNWALWDPVFYPNGTTRAAADHPCYLDGVDRNKRPAECDYCCDAYQGPHPSPDDPSETITDIPAECTDAIRATCANRSPFRGTTAYPYIYDFTYENSLNDFMSFREQLGRDDEHHLYHAHKDQSNWHLAAPEDYDDPGAIPIDQQFHLKDTVGYYTSPYFSLATPDNWAKPPAETPDVPAPKLFPFLYKMADWGTKLSDVTYAKYECHWCDAAGGACPTLPSDSVDYPEIFGPAYKLTLTANPATVPYNNGQGWCVNKSNKGGANDPPIVPDLVGGLSPDVYVNKDVCAINPNPDPISDLNKIVGGWKRGADRYCSHGSSLYSIDCPKHGIASPPSDFPNPQCGQTETYTDDAGITTTITAAPADQWQDDMLDEIIYGEMPEFFSNERSLWTALGTPGGLKNLATTFVEWYGGAPAPGEITTGGGIADWIEPPCPSGSCAGSYTGLARPGLLWVWRAQFQWLNTKIQEWLLRLNPSPSLVGPDAAWCVPAIDDGIHVSPPGELATFDVNANGRGDVADVIACLNWNANDPRTYAGGVPAAVGNAQKFQRCHDSCSADTCTDLPRSLIPDFYDGTKYKSTKAANFFDPGKPDDVSKFTTCLTDAATIDKCVANCKQPPLPSDATYGLPAFVSPVDLAKIQAIESKCAALPPFSGVGFCKVATDNLNCADPVSVVNCKCSWNTGSCSGFLGCSLNKEYFDKVTDALVIAKNLGSCKDPAYLDVMGKSDKEAQVQVEKFKHRLQFLQGRYDEAMALSNDNRPGGPLGMDTTRPDGILTTAINNLTDFLDGGTDASVNATDSPAERLIQARKTHVDAITGDLPAFAIYVWQDHDPFKANPGGGKRWDTNKGYWHAVKVEARIPRRCAGGNCLTDEWPKVFSKTKKAGFLKKGKICYTLINTTGRTHARVIRYDQDKDLRGLLFPGGAKIWESRLWHPKTGPGDVADPAEACKSLIDGDLAVWLKKPETDNRSHIGAAFMLNKVPDAAADSKYADCWKVIHRNLLAHGVQSEACAEYYFAGDGFRVKFVPCDGW